MKRRMKWIATVLCLSVFAAMALGSGQSDSDETRQIVSDEEQEKTDDDESVSDDSGDSVDSSDAVVTIDEQVLVDQDGIVVTATEYVTDSIWGDGVKLLLENNSDRDVTVGCNALIVNDYMITDLFSSEIAAGKKSNETLYLSSRQLNAAGIENAGKIEIYFHIYDSSTYDPVFDSECVVIQTSEYANMDTTPNVGISVDDMSVNGFMMSPFFSTTIYEGKKSIDDITVFSSDLEENGIKTIEEVELKFHIYDADSYSTIADSEPITFTAQ